VGIESEAQRDLLLSETDAENVVGGKKMLKHTAKHATATPAGPRPPLLIKQDIVYFPVVDTTLPESDCDPDNPANAPVS
jgi:hypothetical protein